MYFPQRWLRKKKKKSPVSELHILQPLLSIIHLTVGAKEIFIHASCSLTPEFCRGSSYFRRWRRKRHKKSLKRKKKKLKQISLNTDSIHMFTHFDIWFWPFVRKCFDSSNNNCNTDVCLVPFKHRTYEDAGIASRHFTHCKNYKTQKHSELHIWELCSPQWGTDELLVTACHQDWKQHWPRGASPAWHLTGIQCNAGARADYQMSTEKR